MYDICICIITYNRIEYTKKCIDSFLAHGPKNWSMVIVDNGSNDGTQRYLQTRFKNQKNVRVVLSKRNLYPAGGNQVALAKAFLSKSYLLCDNDGLFMDNGWFPTAFKLLQKPNIGLVNLRCSRWREDKKLGNDIRIHNGTRYFVTTHVASFSLIDAKSRGLLIRRLKGKWIGKVIGNIVAKHGRISTALVDGLIYDQSENDLHNPLYQAQYEQFWKTKRRLKHFNEMVETLQNEQLNGKYINPNRKTGSQSEIPSFEIHNGLIHVDGYQKFTIHNGEVKPISKAAKYNQVYEWLTQILPNSYCDIGASNGVLCFMAAQLGMKLITALDHDKECINLIADVARTTDSPVFPIQYSFGDAIMKHDVTSALAIIHWLWACTAKYNSFHKMLEYLASVTKDYLILEWIDPKDKAIQKFKHLDYGNPNDYTHVNFLAAVTRIGEIQDHFTWEPNRTIYLIKLH